SRAGSLPEIGGNAVRYFTVPDAAELSAAILDVLDNAALRQQLRANASRRAGDFTWCRHLDQLHLVYDGLLRREGGCAGLARPGALWWSIGTLVRFPSAA